MFSSALRRFKHSPQNRGLSISLQGALLMILKRIEVSLTRSQIIFCYKELLALLSVINLTQEAVLILSKIILANWRRKHSGIALWEMQNPGSNPQIFPMTFPTWPYSGLMCLRLRGSVLQSKSSARANDNHFITLILKLSLFACFPIILIEYKLVKRVQHSYQAP